MTEPNRDLSLAQARSLIDSYTFDLGRDDADQLFKNWLNLYPASWIGLATIEALYLGRYKAVSVEQIMGVWLRRGTPNPHFNYEFERLICRKLPKHLSDRADLETNSVQKVVNPLPKDEPELVSHSLATAETDVINLEKAFEDRDEPKALLGDRNTEDNVPLISALGLSGKSNWSELTQDSNTIHQFIPLPDVSSFFNKLKTFGERGLESQ